jgi:phosphoribosyl 1,2-cyclic phosphodiesterase
VQFCLNHNDLKLGVLTDLGSITPHVVQAFSCCDALVLEFNHDPQMLADGPYPYAVKKRVGGDFRPSHQCSSPAVSRSCGHHPA